MTMEKEYLIDTEKNYHEMMIAIYDLMNKGESNLSAEEIESLKAMAVAAERFKE